MWHKCGNLNHFWPHNQNFYRSFSCESRLVSVWSCVFTHVAHDRRLCVWDALSHIRSVLFCVMPWQHYACSTVWFARYMTDRRQNHTRKTWRGNDWLFLCRLAEGKKKETNMGTTKCLCCSDRNHRLLLLFFRGRPLIWPGQLSLFIFSIFQPSVLMIFVISPIK